LILKNKKKIAKIYNKEFLNFKIIEEKSLDIAEHKFMIFAEFDYGLIKIEIKPSPSPFP
jgi:hypothetical protein